MNRQDKIQKLLKLAGDTPTTPEQIEAYQKVKQLIEQELEAEQSVFGGYIGHKSSVGEKLKGTFTKMKSVVKDFKFKHITESVKWEKFYKKAPDQYKIYELTPTPSVRNNQAAVLAKVMASFYRKPRELKEFAKDGTLLKVRSPYRCNFRIVMKANSISFYLVLPKEKAGEVLRKAEAIYDRGITIKEVESLPKLEPAKTFCTELGYRKHDMFSIATDKDNNYPLPSLLTAVRTLEGDDIAIFDAMFEPHSRVEWFKEAREAHKMLENGHVPNYSMSSKVLRGLHNIFNSTRYEILELTRFTKEQKEALEKWRKEEGSYREAARIRAEMQPATRRKQDEEILKSWLRIAVQSDDIDRAKDAAYTIANGWKDLTSDNELDRFDVPAKWTARYLNAIETRKGFSIRFKANKMSTDEAGKFMQLPGRELIQEFPQIQARTSKEVSIPEELSQTHLKHVRVGIVTERGQKKLAVLPLEAYGNIALMAVYDAICTATFCQGKQGTGKSEGFGTVWAYDMVMTGFTVIITDTADGQMLRNFVNCLPEDFPDEKIHILNFDNQAYPIPLGWDDIYGRITTGEGVDQELEALRISEEITSRFISFINSLSATGEFTDRMSQYVTSCMRAITTQSGWSFLDLELALTSPSYREELLKREDVQKEPDIVQDLQYLQEKAAEGKDGSITDNIMSRIKTLSSTQFMANLFLQPPKLQENGKPVLDIRKLMDNEEGGYGHVICVYASGIWNDNQAAILGFMEDKINFNAFSRTDIDQSKRKPVLKWIDEPHKVIKRLEDRLAGTAVEFRKYRVKNLFTGHSIDQMGKAAKSLLDGGTQITSYKTESTDDLKRFSSMFAPYEDYKELYAALPEKHVAINKVRLPSGKNCPAFIAHMVAPPEEVKDRSYLWQECAVKYGRPWKEVKNYIQEKRGKYSKLDAEWIAEKEAAAAEEKARKKQMEKEAQKRASGDK